MMLKPFKNFSPANITQGYHEKHRAIDVLPFRKEGLGAYGTPLVAPFKCTIGKIYTPKYVKENPNDTSGLKNGYGIFMKGDEYEVMYWHTQPVFPVSTGDVVEAGTIVAYCGNSGNVFSKGEYVPLEKRNVPNFDGTHLHMTVSKLGVGQLLDPMDFIDLFTEPQYTIWDELKAISTTLLKMSTLIK